VGASWCRWRAPSWRPLPCCSATCCWSRPGPPSGTSISPTGPATPRTSCCPPPAGERPQAEGRCQCRVNGLASYFFARHKKVLTVPCSESRGGLADGATGRELEPRGGGGGRRPPSALLPPRQVGRHGGVTPAVQEYSTMPPFGPGDGWREPERLRAAGSAGGGGTRGANWCWRSGAGAGGAGDAVGSPAGR